MWKRHFRGWTAVTTANEGIYGVSVRAPEAPTDRPHVASCGFIAGGKLDVSSLAKLSKKISEPGCAWTVTLDRERYKILILAEPPVKADEMDQSVRLAIGTMLDYPVDNADVAWMKIPTQSSQSNRPPHLYVVTTRHEHIAEFSTAFNQAKIPLQAVDVRETAYRNIAALTGSPGEGTALLAVDAQGVQFTVTFQGELYLDRYVKEALFAQGIDDAARERAFERVVLEVQRSLDFVNRTLPFIEINRVMLAPMPDKPGIRDYFANHIPVPVEDVVLSAAFDFSKTPELLLPESQSSYFVALGAALRFMDQSA